MKLAMLLVLAGITGSGGDTVRLPPPQTSGGMTLRQAMAQRRSVREYADQTISLEDLGQLMWAGQGITSAEGFRTAPSAGGLYPLTLYAAVRAVDGLEGAVYRYLPQSHSLAVVHAPHIPLELWAAALQQEALRRAAVVIVVAGAVEVTAAKYGDRAPHYVLQEAGHVAQNVLLEAASLGLASVPIGAFYESHVKKALAIPEEPLLLIPVGAPMPSPELMP